MHAVASALVQALDAIGAHANHTLAGCRCMQLLLCSALCTYMNGSGYEACLLSSRVHHKQMWRSQ